MSEIDDFRERARLWLDGHARRAEEALRADSGEEAADLAEARRFQAALFEAGFAGLTWPREYGGQGLGIEYQVAWNEVSAGYRLPTVFSLGLGMIGPTLLELGTEQQKRRYLPKILSGEEIWCQIFSEPGGGSDVAALRTSATRTDEGWVINGQKVWTSVGHLADLGAVLVRTDPTVPRHQGITMLIVDMRAPGLTVRPLRIATGEAPFAEEFFDNVLVPHDAVIGEVNQGWAAAVVMLRNERIALGTQGRSQANPLSFEPMLAAVHKHGSITSDRARTGLAELYARELALAEFGRLVHEEAIAGIPVGARGSVGKLAGTQQALWAADLAEELLGETIAIENDDLAAIRWASLYATGMAIAGGSTEIQRNIIGERVLGLPKDGGIDAKDVPFNRLRFGDGNK
ncbi:acyl-CoA dehydrogenase family protein [Thermopolyspora sp. NPDC052614]|uniref:acyl-CoA dehydrogenase family protein n=1 Tax=Thermopolyspora sp. NPDC052614 TaxID=3155682 RepID=UPI003434DA6C